MSTTWKIGLLSLALVFVEAAAYWKLASWLRWTNEEPLAFTSALAFVGLLLASIIAMGSNIPNGMRAQFLLGGLWLFAVQALANVLISFQYGVKEIPVAVVTHFFDSDPEMSLKMMAVIAGATLSVVSIAFWQIIAYMLRQHGEEQQRRLKDMQDEEDRQEQS